MEKALLKWWLFFLWLTRIEGAQKLWKPDESAVNHRTMKIILESCYKDESLSNPIVIFGDFRESIDKPSVINLNKFYNFDEEIQYRKLCGRVSYVANKIILIEDSPAKLASDLDILRYTRWWNHMALFFIIEENAKTCENFKDMLITTWKMNILNSIYICTDSDNKPALYTFNPIANYAPSPWKRTEVRPEHLHMFHQFFDSNAACENLHYDKTKILDGYEIRLVLDGSGFPYSVSRRMDFSKLDEDFKFVAEYIPLRVLFTTLDVATRVETVGSFEGMVNHFRRGTADMSFELYSSENSIRRQIPSHFWNDLIAVVELPQEVSTLTKIHQLCTSSVLIVAAITLSILLIILTILNRNFSLAVLDLVRLLTHASISAGNRSHKFRIYFTTMLIFIVITNGIFQGFIVTFLIKPERVNRPQTLDQLGELGYKVYVYPVFVQKLRELCPKCNVEGSFGIECIESLRNEPHHHACFMPEFRYTSRNEVLGLDILKESALNYQGYFFSRDDWPLRNRVITQLSRTFESGILNFWKRAHVGKARLENQAREAEWSSLQYKPLSLNELTFAFQVLGLGLLISLIVFFIELIVAKCGKCSKNNPRILRLN